MQALVKAVECRLAKTEQEEDITTVHSSTTLRNGVPVTYHAAKGVVMEVKTLKQVKDYITALVEMYTETGVEGLKAVDITATLRLEEDGDDYLDVEYRQHVEFY